MIKAVRKNNFVRVDMYGDSDDIEHEITATLMKALSIFTEEDIFKMLATAEGLIDSENASENDSSDKAFS